MSAGWQIGDLAACVSNDPCDCGCGGTWPEIEIGAVYVVCGTRVWDDDLFLLLPEIPPRWVEGHTPDPWFNAEDFRKVVADKHEACETEFVTLLKRSKRKVSA